MITQSEHKNQRRARRLNQQITKLIAGKDESFENPEHPDLQQRGERENEEEEEREMGKLNQRQ